MHGTLMLLMYAIALPLRGIEVQQPEVHLILTEQGLVGAHSFAKALVNCPTAS